MSTRFEIDFLISSTTILHTFIWVQLKMLMNYLIGGNIGHSDNEIKRADSQTARKAKKVVNVKHQKTLSSC